MMCKCEHVLFSVCLIVAAFGGTCAQLLKFEENAYKGVLVAIAPHVPYSKDNQLIKGIKDLFERASKVLFNATLKHASFGSVTIVVPDNWPTVAESKDAYYGYHEAQVRIEDPSPLHGNAPYTQQPGGCGQQGDFIHLTPDFLTNKMKAEFDYGPIDKVFVHEWAHFRYGVFDEYGYPGDPVYPQIYIQDDGTPKLTTCAYPDINVRFGDKCFVDQNTGMYNQSCKFEFDGAQISTSSLMGFHFLDHVNYFCDSASNTHNKDTPTKQNVLCEGKSTWEVIKNHEDFKDFKSNNQNQYKPVTFNIVKAVKSPVFVILDVSSNMKGTNNDTTFPLNQNRFDFVKKALEIFVNILPGDTPIGLQEFDNTLKNSKAMQRVENAKKNFISLIKASDNKPSFYAMEQAIKVGRKQLNDINGGILLLLTSLIDDVGNSDVDQKVNYLCQSLQEANVRVMSILYPPWASKDPLQKHMTLLADRTNGRNFVIQEMTHGAYSKLDVLTQLTSAILNVGQLIEPYSNKNFVIQSESSHNNKEMTGSFFMDTSVGVNTTLMLIKREENDADFRTLILTTPSNRKMDFKNSGFDALGGETIVLYPLPNPESGQWKYSMGLDTTFQDQATVSIFLFSYPQPNADPYTVRTWNNAKMGEIDPSDDNPLILYAEVKKGADPVIGAKVIAKVKRPLENDGNYSTIEVQLLDNGNGAPDVTKDDGIYSRYFTDFNINGHYLVSVVVTNNEHTRVVKSTSGTSSIHPLNKSISYCCGSVVPITNSTPSEDFTRVSNGGVFHIRNLNPNNHINFPPSRITDLHIKEFRPLNGEVILTWTAPGDDYNTGTAKSYEAKQSNNRKQLLEQESFEKLENLNNIPQPSAGGKIQDIIVSTDLDSTPKVVHYAFRTVDTLDKKSKISNIVTVKYPARDSTTPAINVDSTITSNQDTSTATALLSKSNIGIIIGGVGAFLLLIIIIAIISACIIKKRKRKAPPKAVLPLGTPNKESSFKNVPLDDTPQHSPSKQNGKGGVYTVNEQMGSPQFMLASELLAKHAQMKATRDRDLLDQDIKPPYLEDENHHYSPTYDHINPVMIPAYGYTNQAPITHDYYINHPDSNPFSQNYHPNYPFVRTSLSDKPSSSFTSLSTNEPKKDNGYFTSYEETSEDSNPARPSGEMDNGLTSSKSSLARRIVAESQV